MNEKVNFYLIEGHETGNVLTDVTDKIEMIYQHLNKPFDILDNLLIEEFSNEEK